MFGERLKQLRESQGLSQSELADYLNVSRQSIGGYENDNVDPGINTLVKIADRFNVSLDYLLGRTDEKENVNLLHNSNKKILNEEVLIKISEIINSYNITEK